MDNKRVCLIITFVGIFIIIFVQICISIMADNEEKNIEFIESNLVSLSKDCIRSLKCKKEDVTLKVLKEKNYLSGDLLDKLDIYKDESYISYPDYKVNLIKKEG